MRIEDLWRELERELKAGQSPGVWLTRLALPEPTQPLLVGVEPHSARRVLLLPIPRNKMPRQAEWPECRGLEMFGVDLDGEPHLGVRLVDPSCQDVFAVLAEDVAHRVAAASDPISAGRVLIGRLRRWQKFLAMSTTGLSPEQRRGLYGELATIRQLLSGLGPHVLVSAWRAPERTHQDFLLNATAVEVKTTAAKQPQTVRITSERQLDTTGIANLFLHVVVVDERDAGAGGATGEDLPSLVAMLRSTFASLSSAAELFEERLLEACYHDSHAARYGDTRYAIRRTRTYWIRQGFPRITETSLATGVGDVSYALSLAACEPFAVDLSAIFAAVDPGEA